MIRYDISERQNGAGPAPGARMSLQALKLPIVRYLRRSVCTVEESLSDIEFGADSTNELAGRVATRLSGKMA